MVQLCESLHGLTRREWRVLSFLAENEGVLSSELAERAMLDRARTSRTLTLLAEKRLIERRPKPNDRREVQMYLSEAGHRVHDDLFPRIRAINQALVEGLSLQERRLTAWSRGSPRRPRRRFSTEISAMRRRVWTVALPKCGVMITLSIRNRR